MEIERNLNWEPNWRNQIDLTDGTFTVVITKETVEITCDWDYGWGGRGSERMEIPLQKLNDIILEIETAK